MLFFKLFQITTSKAREVKTLDSNHTESTHKGPELYQNLRKKKKLLANMVVSVFNGK